MNNSLDITPSPRVLRMLGQIDFAPWQCLAELIDNSIDAFLDLGGNGGAVPNPRITIALPTDSELREAAGRLSVKDNGPGMILEQLENAVRAGYSGNDPVEKMGLFGMGFNISTARLGRRTEVWTTTADAEEWVGIIIDFEELERAQTFRAPVVTRKKSQIELETNAHGTEVCVTKLEATRTRPLIWGAGKANTKQRLGKVYGRVMNTLGISILYDGDSIKPWRHCTWDAQRTVPTAEFGNVPARIEIFEELPSRKFCNTCWVWLSEADGECPACGERGSLIDRKRCLKGWIGVQRYFDKDHYGFDLIRNGRVIENLDKSLFSFRDAQGGDTPEYVLDTIHWGGRIVGELEVDFVRVSHQKDSFDKLDPEWKHVVELVRGNAPLRPRIAQRMGLAQNTSPLGRLYAGYKAGHAGLKELVPGDSTGRGINAGIIKELVDRFYSGEDEYQSDEKWYELVLRAERALRGESSGDDEAGGDLPMDLGGDEGSDPGQTQGETVIGGDETGESGEGSTGGGTAELYTRDKELTRTFELDFERDSIAVEVVARRVEDASTPQPFSVEASGFTFKFDYNPRHDFFEESLDTPVDCLLTDLAQHFLALSAESPRNYPVSIIERQLRKKYFPESLTNITLVADTAEALLAELREHVDEVLPDIAPIDASAIDDDTLGKIKRRALQADLGDDEFVNDTIKTGKFARYVENRFLVSLIGLWPTLVMDGNFFSNPYSNLADDLKAEAVAMLVNGMEDVRWLAEEGSDAISKDTAWRLRYGRALASMRLVQSWRS